MTYLHNLQKALLECESLVVNPAVMKKDDLIISLADNSDSTDFSHCSKVTPAWSIRR